MTKDILQEAKLLDGKITRLEQIIIKLDRMNNFNCDETHSFYLGIRNCSDSVDVPEFLKSGFISTVKAFYENELNSLKDEFDKLGVVRTDNVRVAHWEDCSNGWMCSYCNRDSIHDSLYCPNCGAFMQNPGYMR